MFRKPLRLWPGVVIVALQWLIRFGVPLVAPEAAMYGMLGGLAGGLALVVWWLFFSRAPWSERLGAVALMIVALAATPLILHESIATGAMGMLFYLHAIPFLSLAFVVWAVATRHVTGGLRWATMAAAILLACGSWALVRTEGFDGTGDSDFAWRWSPTYEERLLAQVGDEVEPLPPAAPETAATPEEPALPQPEESEEIEESATLTEPSTPAATETPETSDEPSPAQVAVERTAPSWPGFRGSERDGVVRGVRVETDWSASPPVELWRRPIGPGWSSFAVQGSLFYTQEQRGGEEIVAAYDVATGEPVWAHRDTARFWESNAGAGPRATPTLSDGRVYTLGATGILNVLDAEDGGVLWSVNAVSDTGVEIPHWGIASSPLVVGDLVVVATAGRLAAYETTSGTLRWLGPEGGWGYSSPHLATFGGIEQILLLNGTGAIGVAPSDGTVLWEYPWPGDGIVQPAFTADGDLLIGTGSGMGSGAGMGVRRAVIQHGTEGWSVEERWTSRGLKPYFNDFVVHEGHAYGFDGGILSSIRLTDGKRQWKGGRYGHGQLVLLPDQDTLLVLSERGELALVEASPDQFTELARHPAIEGKTWNHPVLVDDVLLVRNGQEMVAFRLARAEGVQVRHD